MTTTSNKIHLSIVKEILLMTKKYCEPCHDGAKALNEKQVLEKIQDLGDWHYDTEHLCLVKKYQFKGIKCCFKNSGL